MTDRPTPSAADRRAAIAAARARLEPTGESPLAPPATESPQLTARRTRNTASRILVSGAAVSAGIVMVGAMAAAANAGPDPAAVPVERVVVIEITNPPSASPSVATPTTAGTEATPITTSVREVRVVPAPAADPMPAPAVTEGS